MLFTLAALVPLVTARTFTMKNGCQSAIRLWINGQYQGDLPSSGSTTRDFGVNFSGFIYTDSFGGNATTGGGITKAGFLLEDNYYYIVKDDKYFNTPLSIAPSVGESSGFCPVDTCASASCNNAYNQSPTRFPRPSSTPPSPPLYQCSGSSTGYTVTFCPSGSPPTSSSSSSSTASATPSTSPVSFVNLHPNGNRRKCLDVRGNKKVNGTPVQIYDCNGSGAQKWVINNGNTKVRLAGTNFCLDAGSNPASGVGMKIWTCYLNLPAQAWYYTNDKRIAVTGKGQCLDLTNGSLKNGNRIQTWRCTDFNVNQIWTV